MLNAMGIERIPRVQLINQMAISETFSMVFSAFTCLGNDGSLACILH